MSQLNENTKIFAGNANLPLAKRIAHELGHKLGSAEITRFSDGEINVEITEHVRDYDIIIIQPTCSPTNENIMELLIMVDAFKRSAVRSITAVIPFYGYSRCDRSLDFVRSPITSKLVADMLQVAGVGHVIVVDIHSTQQQGFFKIPVTNILAGPELFGDIWKKHCFDIKELVIVSPDVGGVVRARCAAKQLDNAELAIIDKRRPSANVSEVMNIIGNVDGKRCVIIDDMVDTAGTLCKAAAALKERGAKCVSAYATHGIFSGKAFDNINSSVLDEVVVTDTVPVNLSKISKKIRIVSIAGLIAESIRRINNRESLSDLYIS